MNPSNNDTLNIKPLPSTMPGWSHATMPKNPDGQAAAAEAAREHIASMTEAYSQNQPAFTLQANPLSTPVSTPVATTFPQPVSPAAEQKKVNTDHKFDRIKPVFTALATFLFIIMLFKAPVLYSQIRFLTSSHPVQTNALPVNSAAAEVVPANPVITIPKINVTAPIVFPTSTANSPNYDPELENGVVHYPNTALPGQNGNAVIFGHSSNDWWQPGSYKFIFVLLDKLVPGDTFSVNYNSKRYIYEVTSSRVVEATDVSVLNPTAQPTITLITCWPAGTSLKREIISAKQISPAPAGSGNTQTSQPSTKVLPSSAPTFVDQLKGFLQQVTGGLAGKANNANESQPGSQTTDTSSSGGSLPGN